MSRKAVVTKLTHLVPGEKFNRLPRETQQLAAVTTEMPARQGGGQVLAVPSAQGQARPHRHRTGRRITNGSPGPAMAFESLKVRA